jgi:hypothetical protein
MRGLSEIGDNHIATVFVAFLLAPRKKRAGRGLTGQSPGSAGVTST